MDIIETKSIVRMTHDFKTAKVELRGVSKTEKIEKPFGGKNLDTLCSIFADSIEKGEAGGGLPRMEDAFIASKISWEMLADAEKQLMPSIGDNETLVAIRERRSKMTDGYGLIKKRYYEIGRASCRERV